VIHVQIKVAQLHIHTCADPKVEIPPKIQDHVWRYDGRNTQGQLVHVTSPANNLAVVWRDLLISQEFSHVISPLRLHD
jgi:hypothetical protein